jgi:hypothetical protein
VAAAGLDVLELDVAFAFRMLEQIGEVAVSHVRLVEAGIHAAQGLLDHRSPDRIVVETQRVEDLEHPIARLVFSFSFETSGEKSQSPASRSQRLGLP